MDRSTGSPPNGTLLDFEALKTKHRAIRDGCPIGLNLRVHRSLSWLQRAEMEDGDDDARFLFQWIAFNAAYAAELRDPAGNDERSVFDEFFRKLTGLDRDHRIYNAIWERYPQAIRVLLDNRYVYAPFWKHQNGLPGYADWEDRFQRSKSRIGIALRDRDTRTILATVFDRLYVLRNQLVHGGATWNSGVNRSQVRDGARIMTALVPVFVDLMMDNPDVEWGDPYYPVVE